MRLPDWSRRATPRHGELPSKPSVMFEDLQQFARLRRLSMTSTKTCDTTPWSVLAT